MKATELAILWTKLYVLDFKAASYIHKWVSLCFFFLPSTKLSISMIGHNAIIIIPTPHSLNLTTWWKNFLLGIPYWGSRSKTMRVCIKYLFYESEFYQQLPFTDRTGYRLHFQDFMWFQMSRFKMDYLNPGWSYIGHLVLNTFKLIHELHDYSVIQHIDTSII